MINNDYSNVILYQEGADTGRVLLQGSPTLLFSCYPFIQFHLLIRGTTLISRSPTFSLPLSLFSLSLSLILWGYPS